MTDELLENGIKTSVSEENDNLYLVGYFVENFEFHHEQDGQKFYRNTLAIKRLSGITDNIIVEVPEKEANSSIERSQTKVELEGIFRSNYIIGDDNKKHLDLFVYTNTINQVKDNFEDCNYIFLKGKISKPTRFRVTPKKRVVTDLIIEVKSSDGGINKIPCIAWEKNAEESKKLRVDDKIEVIGRVQSREYHKGYDTRTAYEISIQSFKKI